MCVGLQVHICVSVCFHRQITTATALFGCSFPSRSLTPPHELVKLVTSEFVNFFHISSLFLLLKVFPHVLASLFSIEYVQHTCVGRGRDQRRLVLICIYVLVVKLIQITIIISGCDVTLISSQISFIHLSKPITLRLPFKLGPDCSRPIR